MQRAGEIKNISLPRAFVRLLSCSLLEGVFLMSVGRPLKFASLDELQSQIDDYFETYPNPKDWTITGLALHLKTSRQTLCNYEKDDQFFDAIKEAKQRVEMSYEQILKGGGGAGPIFVMKNMGWTDKSYLDHTTDEKPINNVNVTILKGRSLDDAEEGE